MILIQMFTVLAAGMLLPPGGAIGATDAIDTQDEPVVIKKICVGEGEEGDMKLDVVVLSGASDEGEGETKKCVVVTAIKSDDGEGSADPAQCKRIILKREGGHNIEAGGPWLGIRFGPVPKPLASHLAIDADAGQMVLNVVDGSPADEAGMERYDVIVKIDGEDVPSGVKDFLDKVRDMEPGVTYGFTVIRGSEQTVTNVTVSERPEDVFSAKYKYEEAVEEFMKCREFRRGGLMEKDDEGNWLFKQFDHEDMPDIFKHFPDGHGFNFDFDFSSAFPHSQCKEFLLKSDEGSTLRIESGKDGTITITRTKTENGEETTTTKIYENEDELKADDIDTYNMLHKGPCGGKISIFGDADANAFTGMEPHGHHGIFTLSPDDLDIDIEAILEGTDGEAHERLKELFHGKLDKHKLLGLENLDELKKDVFILRKPRTSFEILSDGKIRVIRRRGSEELVEDFMNAEALKAKRPGLYQKYERLHGQKATR